MKKKIVTMSCYVSAAFLGGLWIASQKVINSNDTDSSLLKQNVEALSQTESESARIKCYSSLTYELGASVVFCGDCLIKENRTDKWYCIHDYCFTN